MEFNKGNISYNILSYAEKWLLPIIRIIHYTWPTFCIFGPPNFIPIKERVCMIIMRYYSFFNKFLNLF